MRRQLISEEGIIAGVISISASSGGNGVKAAANRHVAASSGSMRKKEKHGKEHVRSSANMQMHQQNMALNRQ